MKKNKAETSLYSNYKDDNNIEYYKDFSFYNIVEAAYSINKSARLSKIEKNSDSSFTLTISFNKRDAQLEKVVSKLKQIKYFYRIDKITQDNDGNVSITFIFNNQHKVENTV
ncbi:hypothetical protein [Clostridium oryzae]|nr:hypothetical protein [Clostridium oryzae]